MSTPHQYDPEKANAWARQPDPDDPDVWDDVGMRLEMLDRRARAVIAAGRPHDEPHIMKNLRPRCVCPQCAAWDALKALMDADRL